MPDAAGKVTIFFQAQGGTAPTGWTETFWTSEADLKQNVVRVRQFYLPKRIALLGAGTKVAAIRATAVPGNRLSYIEFPTGKEGEPSVFDRVGEDSYDPTQVDLLVRLQTANGHRRQFWVGGLPDSQTDQLKLQGVTGQFTNSPGWKQFSDAIIKSGFNIRYKATAGPPPTYLATPITDIFPIMVRNRKRGRPFFLFRGRSAV